MQLNELRAIAKVSQDNWLVTWHPDGYVISKGENADMHLTAARGGERYIKSLDAVANVMTNDLGIAAYIVRGPAKD